VISLIHTGVREELAKINPSVKDVPILTADAK
jgi:hypothetical protein